MLPDKNTKYFKHIYKIKDNILLTNDECLPYKEISYREAEESTGKIYLSFDKSPLNYRSLFKIIKENLIDSYKEGVEILNSSSPDLFSYPSFIKKAIEDGRAFGVNSSYNDYHKFLSSEEKDRPLRVNIIGLGDVGGILATGLRLLGNDIISSIGLYDRDYNKIDRWYQELSSINSPTLSFTPEIHALKEEEVFSCDVFIFCVSVGVPEIGSKTSDVRLIQFEGNKKVISYYSRKARESGFNGQFFVVSDPVDLLCKAAFLESNKNSKGEFDFNGLPSHRIHGFGLGVMNARAAFIAKEDNIYPNYNEEGRVFGPHGEGLVAANSILNYDQEASLLLTERTMKANLKVRATGFKPYIAPALSSGALSILAALRGQWHCSSSFLGGIFFGANNKINEDVTLFESLPLPVELQIRLKETEEYLRELY